MNAWESSPGHNAVMLNEGIWAGLDVKAMACGLVRGVAHVWFDAGVDAIGIIARY